MTEKEIGELRRRFRPDKSNITHIRGCYVNEQREIISMFNQSVGLMQEEESEKFLAMLKRTLSGTPGKNLIDITFSTNQVLDSEEHKLLTALKTSSLKDEEVVEAFFQKVIDALAFEGNYLILLAHDTYDVPYRGKDGTSLEDASNEMFSYILCSICPVKMTKPALSYVAAENEFHNRKVDWIVAPPELGFLFPAFDGRRTNLYNALYYTRSASESHTEFADAIFHTEFPLPATIQKQTFQAMLANALEEDCSFEVVQGVHEQLSTMVEAHKADKESEPLVLSKREVQAVLESCGVSEQKMSAFSVQYDEEFGCDTDLSPRNIIDARQFEVRTPDVVIRVSPERRDLIETRVINGTKYIMICADDGVEVNGVNIYFPGSEPQTP